MLNVTVEGIYETDIGSGQKKYTSFNYTFKTSRTTERGLGTHVMRRFIPYLIANDKNKKSSVFSRLKSYVITNIQHVEDTKDCIIGKEIKNLDEWQIQDLAATLDLYEVPLFGSCSITEMRDKAILAYMKKVLKIPMKETKDKAELSFFKKQPDGTFTLDFSNEEPMYIAIPEGYMGAVKKEKTKKTLADFTKKVGQSAANTILAITGNQPINPPVSKSNDGEKGNPADGGFPSADELTKGLNN